MSSNKSQHGTPFSVTTSGTTSAVASQAGVTGSINYVTDIAASSDKAGAILTVKQGTTTIWEVQIGATAFQEKLETPLISAIGALVSVTVDGTSLCKANIAGFTL